MSDIMSAFTYGVKPRKMKLDYRDQRNLTIEAAPVGMADLHRFERGQFIPFNFAKRIALVKAAPAPRAGSLDDHLVHVAAHRLQLRGNDINRDTGPDRMQAQRAAKV